MRPLPNDFTFDDNSTLTSFTDLREHPKGPGVEYDAGYGAGPEITDRRSEDSDGRSDKENSDERRDAVASPDFKLSRSGGNRSSRSGDSGSTKSSSLSSKQFWATLSSHAASAAFASSAEYDNPNSMAEAAANAAAKSLLEDSSTMEQINAARLKQKEAQPEKATKPPMKITHQTVRNAASKASIAVLQTGVNQEVAAAVASVILREGGSMLGKTKASPANNADVDRSVFDGSISSKETSSTSSTMSTVFSSPSKASSKIPSFPIARRKKTKNLVVTSNSSLASISDDSASHCSRASAANGSEAQRRRGAKESTLGEQRYRRGGGQRRNEDDATHQSISTSKYDKDKYMMSGDNSNYAIGSKSKVSASMVSSSKGSISKGSISKGSVAKSIRSRGSAYKGSIGVNSARRSLMNEVGLDDDHMTQDALEAVEAAVEIMGKKVQDSSTSMSTLTSAETGQNDINMNREVMDAVREAMAMMEQKEQKPDSVSSTLTSTIVTSLMTQRSNSQEDQASSSTSSSSLPSRQQKNAPDEIGRVTPLSSTGRPDDSTIETQSYHELGQVGSAQMDNDSYVMNTSVDSKVGNADLSSHCGHQWHHQPLNNAPPHGQVGGEQLLRHTHKEEERKLEQKQANYLAAMDLLQKKLNELECCDDGHHSSSSSSNARLAQPPLASKQHHAGQQQYQQLHQLSMLANPAMSGLRKTTSSMGTPTIGNLHNTAPMHSVRASSSTSTHFPPLPPINTILSVETGHHGYHHVGDGSGSALADHPSSSSSTSGSTARIAITAVNSGLTNGGGSAAPSVRSVLKAPSKCFPIIEMGDEMGPDWEDDGAVFMPVGECRIGRSGSTAVATPGGDEAEDDSEGTEVSLPAEAERGPAKGVCRVTPSACADAAATRRAKKEEEEEEEETNSQSMESVEVVLVAESNPMSPAARLRSRFRDFFRRRSKTVRFNMDQVDVGGNDSSPPRGPSPSLGPSPPFSAKNGTSGVNKEATQPAAAKHSVNVKCGSSASTGRLSRLRETFLRALRRGRPFKLSDSRKHSGGGVAEDASAADTTAMPSVTAVGSNTSSLAPVLRGSGNKSESESSESSAETIGKWEAGIKRAQAEANGADNSSKKSGSDAGARSADGGSRNPPGIAPQTSSIARNDSDWINSYVDDISSKYTGDDGADVWASPHRRGRDKECGTAGASAVGESSAGSASRGTNTNGTVASSSSDGDTPPKSRFAPSSSSSSSGSGAPHKQRSVYISDVIKSLPTYGSGESFSEESWVETVLQRITKGEVKGLGLFANGGGDGEENDNATTGSSAKSSYVGFNFV